MSPAPRKSSLLVVAWVITLLASALPAVLWNQFSGQTAPAWIYYVRIGLPLLLIFVSAAVPLLSPLRNYFFLLAVVNLGYWLVTVVRALPAWQAWEGSVKWMNGMLVLQSLEVGIALLVLAALFLLLRKPANFWLGLGDLKATAYPVPWIGFTKPSPWKTFGLIVAGAAFILGIIFLWLSNQPTAAMWQKLLPALPGVILLSAVNALDEEIIFRNGLLAPLFPAVGAAPALWLTAVYFGMAHYSGTFPGGLIWFALTAFLGWLFGKAMLETRGVFWSWLMHFLSDLPVFAFTAMVFMQ
jgi:hypothetical protein